MDQESLLDAVSKHVDLLTTLQWWMLATATAAISLIGLGGLVGFVASLVAVLLIDRRASAKRKPAASAATWW